MRSDDQQPDRMAHGKVEDSKKASKNRRILAKYTMISRPPSLISAITQTTKETIVLKLD